MLHEFFAERVAEVNDAIERALDCALDIWEMTTMEQVRARSITLSELFIAEVERLCPTLTLASPRDAGVRGSQVSFRFEDGYSAIQALIDREVIGDFRAPDIMRFGFTPLYLDEGDIRAAAEHVATVINDSLWNDPKYQTRSRVT